MDAARRLDDRLDRGRGLEGGRLSERNVQDAVDGSGLQIGDRNLRIRDDLEDKLLDPGHVFLEVAREALQGDVVVGHPLGELERSAANRLLVEFGVDLRGHDAEQHQAVNKVGLGRLQGQLDRIFVDDLVGVDPSDARGEDRLFVGDALERVLDVAGFDLLAIVVLRALAEVEDVRLIVRVLPLLGKIRNVIEVGTIANQRVEHVEAYDVAIDEGLIGVRIAGLDVVGRGDDGLRGQASGFGDVCARGRFGRGRGCGRGGGRCSSAGRRRRRGFGRGRRLRGCRRLGRRGCRLRRRGCTCSKKRYTAGHHEQAVAHKMPSAGIHRCHRHSLHP